MMDVSIDLTGYGEEDHLEVDLNHHGLNDWEMKINGLSLVLDQSQLEMLYFAIKPWFDDGDCES